MSIEDQKSDAKEFKKSHANDFNLYRFGDIQKRIAEHYNFTAKVFNNDKNDIPPNLESLMMILKFSGPMIVCGDFSSSTHKDPAEPHLKNDEQNV